MIADVSSYATGGFRRHACVPAKTCSRAKFGTPARGCRPLYYIITTNLTALKLIIFALKKIRKQLYDVIRHTDVIQIITSCSPNSFVTNLTPYFRVLTSIKLFTFCCCNAKPRILGKLNNSLTFLLTQNLVSDITPKRETFENFC